MTLLEANERMIGFRANRRQDIYISFVAMKAILYTSVKICIKSTKLIHFCVFNDFCENNKINVQSNQMQEFNYRPNELHYN